MDAKKGAKAMTTKIKTAYLMWIGKESYPTIQDWVDEALAQGVSKRLPNAAVAGPLTEDGSVVFVAHDEGVYHECPECTGTIDCPECRKREAEIARLDKEVAALLTERIKLNDAHHELETIRTMAHNAGDDDNASKLEEQVKQARKLVDSNTRKIGNREKKQEQLTEDMDNCADCNGTQKMTAGTGGNVTFHNGQSMDYRKYNYFLHQPKFWVPENLGGIKDKEMCEHCGGTGRLPDGVVFGMFVPSAVEYILKPEDDDAIKEQMKDAKIRTVSAVQVATEAQRKCGVRHAGGVYVVTDTTEDGSKPKEIVEELIAKGLIEPAGVDVKGNFVEFLAPVSIETKRFRGIKRWSLDPDAEDEAEMALDAME